MVLPRQAPMNPMVVLIAGVETDRVEAVRNPKSTDRRKPPTANAAKGVRNSHTSPAQIRLQERRAEALELRRQGYSYPQIARLMN